MQQDQDQLAAAIRQWQDTGATHLPVNTMGIGLKTVDDHLARRTFRCRAWDLGAALGWAGRQGSSKGFAGATVSCEPAGHRWRVLGQLAADRGMPFVCVQPMLTSWARRREDLTFDKTDLRKTRC
jgi:hypothetical protein